MVAGILTGFFLFVRKPKRAAAEATSETKNNYIVAKSQPGDFQKAVSVIKGMQKMITEKFQAVEDNEFKFDSWTRPDKNGCG